MVEEQLIARGISDKKVLAAMRKVPREEFMRPEDREDAYFDGALSINQRQTISQPYMVARMVELLELKGNEKVLEVGTGSGYQAAVLGEIANSVYTIERIPELVNFAKDNLEKIDCQNVEIIEGDGTRGLPEMAPFDAIIVAAAAYKTPPALEEQLAEGGRILIPIGVGGFQVTTRITKQKNELTEEQFDGCVYVPLIGDY